MNPSFDKTATVEKLEAGHVNLVREVRYDVGGKGVNVAIVLNKLGANVNCVGCLGADDESAYTSKLYAEGLDFSYIAVPGKLRVNLKLRETSTGQITELNEPGITLNEEKQADFTALLLEKTRGSEYVVLSGRLPLGCGDNTYQKLLKALSGKKCVLDADGAALMRGIEEKPFLIKPNLPELEGVVGRQLRTLREIRDAARTLMAFGAQNVVVSMGKYGAMYINEASAVFSPALRVKPRSTVGAGDAMVGGILCGLSKGESMLSAFRFGVAAGAASVLTDGTQPLEKAAFDALLPKVTQQEV